MGVEVVGADNNIMAIAAGIAVNIGAGEIGTAGRQASNRQSRPATNQKTKDGC